MVPRLKFLQPQQYASWMRKIDDSDWTEHRYRDAKDRVTISAMRELRCAYEHIDNLTKPVTDEEFDAAYQEWRKDRSRKDRDIVSIIIAKRDAATRGA